MSNQYTAAYFEDPFRGTSSPAQLMPGDLVSLSRPAQPLHAYLESAGTNSVSWFTRIVRGFFNLIGGQSVESRQHELVRMYQIEVLADSQVRFTIPAGYSRLDLLRDTQALSMMLDEPKIYITAVVLKNWKSDPLFSVPVIDDVIQTVNGNVEDSIELTDAEQRQRGLNQVATCSLAAAHAAYYIATGGRDLFKGNAVRSREQVLIFRDSNGLAVDNSRGKFERSPTLAGSLELF